MNFYFQETHLSLADEKKRLGKLKGPILFSHGKTNSCGVATGYIRNNKVDILDKKIDKNGRISILDVMVDETNFVLVNIYNPNTEAEQVTTILDLGKISEIIKDFSVSFTYLFLYIPRFVWRQTNSEKEIYG